MAHFDLTDREWSIIVPLLPNRPRGVVRTDGWRVLNAIVYTVRTGSAVARSAGPLRLR